MDTWYTVPGFHQPLSCFSHLVGAVIYAALAPRLLRPVWRDEGRFWYVAVFVAATILMLTLSSTYHMFAPGGTTRQVMLRLDYAGIFTLIAATFTPIHGILFRGWRRWGVLGLVWTIAILGITLRSIFFEGIPRPIGLAIFIGMGWLGAYTAYLVWKLGGEDLLFSIVAGGVCYTLGALFNALRWPTIIPRVWGPHESFHFAVLAGLGCHWWVVGQVVRGCLSPMRSDSLSSQAAKEAYGQQDADGG
jgi:channel protein (hemolysin III family)